jgi:outer membrane protein OmpA-like peptidoglycan-associated protein
MMKKMKKILIILFSVFSTMAYAYERNYKEGYTIEPSQVNDGSMSKGLSLLNGKFAYTKGGKVYVATLNDSLDVESLALQEDLTNLDMDGQFAQINDRLYFTKDGVLYCARLNNGEWKNEGKVKIEGMDNGREMGEGSSLAYRRWTYRTDGVRVYNPALSADGNTLYFTSNEIEGGKGGRDIWYVKAKNGGKSWSNPVNLSIVNTDQDEDYLKVVGDSAIYFSSNRTDTLKGINLFKVLLASSNAKPEMLFADFNSQSDDAEFIVAEGCPFIASNRGGTFEIYRPEKKEIVIEEAPVDTTPVDTLPPLAVERKEFKKCILYFIFDKTSFIDSYDAEFKYIYEFINEDQTSTIMIVGHTDSRGSDEYNQILSENRAKAVYNRLIKMGVPASRLKYRGEGEKDLAIKNAKTNAEHQKNRRVELIKID